jgi:O-antigen/teichoic acid export membrane protein
VGVTENRSDHLSILSGTSQNLAGIVIAAVATFATNLLISNTLGRSAFGVVTLVTQAAFVISFATRAGMDMAVLRDVAVEVGVGRHDRVRTPVARASAIGALVSLAVAVVAYLAADSIRRVLSIEGDVGRWVVEAAAVGLPFLALANVWLSATRGLKIMRYTLYIFWAGQPLLWFVMVVAGWQLSKTAWMSVLAYSLSWVIAAGASWAAWRRESAAWPATSMERGEMRRLFRYAGPRAPAALFSQLLFWTDLFVLTRYASSAEVGVYSAALRAGQIIVLFLTSVSLMFSPYVADLHNRGETERLDKLFKNLTRWTIAATMPVFLLLAVAPEQVLRVFGPDFGEGEAALLVLAVGQLVNIATGSVGFVLIMVGRTGWDLLVYAGSLVMNLGLAFWLCPKYGIEGAAIANAATFAASKWVRLALVRRFVGIQPYDRDYWRLLLPSGAGLAAMYLIHQLVPGGFLVDLVATGLGGTIVYVAVYLAMGLTEAERRGLTGVLSRLKAR